VKGRWRRRKPPFLFGPKGEDACAPLPRRSCETSVAFSPSFRVANAQDLLRGALCASLIHRCEQLLEPYNFPLEFSTPFFRLSSETPFGLEDGTKRSLSLTSNFILWICPLSYLKGLSHLYKKRGSAMEGGHLTAYPIDPFPFLFLLHIHIL
jgi:hypothetical protein